ncbi:pericentrin isoform X3 [Zalophus californianus]|uniref:Pericentrin isoform X3 n=1 Tax=Zalophus californianus TaxID=9704 RepID=A0A6J2C007_ZALCA|nr:pericentrin isoform X3 [Zalophus californianus]
MEEDEQEQRRRKVEAGRAKLAHFRQRKTKGDCAHPKKKTAKRKGPAVDAPVQEESPVATKDGGLLGRGDVCKDESCGDTPDGAGAAQVEDLSGERTGHLEQPQQKLDDNHLEQPGVLTEDYEQEYTLVIAELMRRQKGESGTQQQVAMELQRLTEMQQMQLQTQQVPSLELEALRLSLSNMHTAQLELTQANLQKEKETALTELRAMLNGRHAQELALLRSRQQQELELTREQHAREREEMVQRCSRETAELKEKLQAEMEKNARTIENLKQDWESERGLCLENLRRELSAKHRLELENLQDQFKKELAEQKAELEKIFQAKNQAECALRTLETQQEATLRQLREDLQSERGQYVRDLEQRLRDQEAEKQMELESLRASYAELKAQSQEELRRLWSQLESPTPDGQDSSEFHDQLPALTPHGEELERLKRDFQQQRQREKAKHESELEQLRIYFEKKLEEAEKSYQEDLIVLQQRLQVNEESLLESVEISPPSVSLEERSEEERREPCDGLRLQPELEENHRCQRAALKSSLEARQEVGLVGTQVLEGEQRVGLSEGPGEELARVPLPCAQDTALEVETEVAARVLGLETEHKLKLSLLQTELKEEIDVLKLENRNLHEKLQHEVHLKEDLERVKHNLVEDHQEELKKAKEKLQLMKQEFKDKEAEWKVASENLKKKAEEELALMLLDLKEQAEAEKQSIINKFELREVKMRQLQDQQAAQILDLEGSLVEQQGRLQQLELGLAGDECPQCSQCGREPGGRLAPADQAWELAALRLKEDCALQLMQAQNRFLKERKEITEKFTAEQDAVLREAQEKHACELHLLQERHQQHILSLTAELEARHQAEVEELRASVESEQRALSEARVAELQTQHAAAVSALEARHASHLDSLESRRLSELQAMREGHRWALEQLRADLEKQLQRKGAFHPSALTQGRHGQALKRGQELPPAEDGLRTQRSGNQGEGVKALVPPELPGVQQGEFGSEKKKVALHEKEETHRLECEQAQSLYQKEKESLFLQLQEKNNQILQLKDQILLLSHEVEECRSELEKLQQRRERENQEGTNLISMLKSDMDLSARERRALQDALRRLLSLFGEMLKAAITLKSRIGERVGLCLEDEGLPDAQPSGQALSAVPVLDEMWPGSEAALLELDKTLSEFVEMSSDAEISSHICESFFMSPESSLECEQPIRRIYRSLGLAVDGLLELALDSTRQLEEARQIHSRFEKEFTYKNEETAQVVRKHQELLERLDEENMARTRLTLELHQAQGIIEGFKVEKASLQEALGQKETAERSLAVELESLRQQLERATQQQAELKEENSALWTQKEALAAEAEEREAGTPVPIAHEDSALRREVECLTQEQSEARKQSERDRAALLSQMKVFEAELEEQLSRHEACAKQAEELSSLKQQMVALDKHLRSQRQFMDEQAVDREHEREEFQQEIQRLEEQLRQATRPRPQGPCVHDEPLYEQVELLQEQLREKSDGFNELVIKKELADRKMLIQEEEIKRLEETNVSCRREAAQLREELEKQRDAVKALQQDKEVLREQQMSNLLLVSTLQSKLNEGRCPVPPAGSCPEGPEALLEAAQKVLQQRDSEVLDLKEQLGKIKDDLVSKSNEVLHLNLKLDAESRRAAVRVRELQEENASLKVPCDRSSEIEELRSIIENLRDNQQRLQREKAEEVEQLHEVIERLQRELSCGGPAVHGAERAVNDDLQPAEAPVSLNHPGLHEQDNVMESELLSVKNKMPLRTEDHGKVPGRMKNKEKLLEDCQLQKVGLISQVRELQEKLNRLMYSVNLENIETEDFKHQQLVASSHALENSSSDSSSDGEETGKSTLVDAFHSDKTMCDLIDLSGNQDPLIKNEMSNVAMEDQVDLQDGSLCLQAGFHAGCHDLTHIEGPGPLKNALRAVDLSSWSSPEVVRKDSTLEPVSSLPLTPCSDALSLDASLQDRTGASVQADHLELLWSLGGSAAGKASRWAESPLAVDRAPSADQHVQRMAVEKDVEDFIVTSLDAQEKPRSSPLGFEGKNNGSENSDASGFAKIVNQDSGRRETPTASPPVPPPTSARFRWPVEAMEEKEVHPKQVKALLQMVCDESHHILALSECRGPPSALSKGEPSAALEHFPREGPGLLEVVPALRRHPNLVPQKGEKDLPGMCLDWRGEFLQVVQEAFGKEREMLRAELQPQPCGSDPGDHSSLLERLEKVVQQQEKSLEHLRLSDRSSLLSEIQALRAQLRMTHLQNQEKLQQLCAALTSAEARGSRQEHQLRRQVELLAYKVEQEKRIASDVQKTLNEEQEKASSVRKLLVVEQTVVRDLRSELHECKQDNERLLASLSEAQKEVLQLRSVLDSKESNLKVALQELECERGKKRALQSRLQEEHLQHLQKEGQSSKTLEELRASLEKQCAQSNRLCVALKHEQTAKDNLQKELQIEASRCEALLAQERGQLSELRRSLEAEKGRSLELAAALQHERLLTEQLSRLARDTPAHHAVLRRLKDEKSRAVELQARLEQVDVQKRRAELEREKEVRAAQTPAVERPQAREPRHGLRREGESSARLAAREGREDVRRRAETGPGQADVQMWPTGDKEKLRELELQHQRDEHKIRQLQRTVQALEAKAAARQSPEAERLQEERHSLEKVRQQLLCAAGLLTSFVSQMVDRTISDWTSSNEKAVSSLLCTLEELKSDLSTPSSSQKKMTAELQTQLVDVLLKDNDSLTKALRTVTQEKADLCRAVSQLEKSLKQHLLKRGVWSRPDKSAWKQDGAVSQSSAGQPDPALPAPATREEGNTCSVHMEKLYLHYLRAESFRKALIYQKKYLLLLIGGFQDSEQETLSMIAHLGVFPSKADKKITTSRPFTKFRTAVRVVIAILRLRFLVKKWQEVNRKGAVVAGRAPRLAVVGEGFPAPRQQPPPKSSTSPPTRDLSTSHAGDRVPKASLCRRERSTPSPHSRLERSLTASQDPEHSLTEYIHHLEMIQQRLGGTPSDPASKKSCRQKITQ